jgi:hypothetical protein
LAKTASRSSLNYDLSSYEAKRLLNLVEELAFEDHSIASESQFQAAVSRRQSLSSYHRPAQPITEVALPRTSSDISLYTPMRRRSLLTPGVATRPPPADLTVSFTTQPRHSLPVAPARLDSLEAMGTGLLAVPRLSFDSNPTYRPHTPCDSEYKQTGAFKHGTLRITNGSPSPARTPAPEKTNESQVAETQGSYFRVEGREKGKQTLSNTGISDGSQCAAPRDLDTAASSAVPDDATSSAKEQENVAELLPELKLAMTPISFGDMGPKSPDLQTTSKHTAVEDLLFEDGPHEDSAEALNVRIDPNAKSNPARRSTTSEEESHELSRSDSGIVVSPKSKGPHASLSKADSGYSSSVSVRSFSLKRNGWEKDNSTRNIGIASPEASTFAKAEVSGDNATSLYPTNIAFPEASSQAASSDAPPPPVPEKDQSAKAWKQKVASVHASGPSVLNDGSPSRKALVTGTPQPSNPASPVGASLSTTTSNLSISSAPRKGRIQRLLNGARAPLTAQTTHPLEEGHNIPPVPQAAQAKLKERTLSSPDESESVPLRTNNQAHVLEVTASSETRVVEHQVAAQGSADGSTSRIGQNKTLNRKASFTIHAISSTISRAASSVIGKNPITWKPTLGKAKQELPDVAASTPVDNLVVESKQGWQGGRTMNLNAVVTLDDGTGYRSPAFTAGRSRSLSTSVDGPSSVAYYDTPRDNASYRGEQHISAMYRLPSTSQYAVSKTPPPISMRTRNIGHLRVPPPIRPRSTPPVRPAAPTVARKRSRDGIQSYPPNTNMDIDYTDTSRRSSLESSYSYSTAQTRRLINMQTQAFIPNATRLSGYGPQPGEYRVPNSAFLPQNGSVLPQQPSYDHSRHSSMVSHTSQQSAPSFRQPRPHAQLQDQSKLRHRSSYDGHSLQTQEYYGRDNGPYPSLPHTNGQPHVSYVDNYLKTLPISQQAGQYQLKPQSGSQGHYRHNSFDQYRPAGPYRVLHSYNSPSYRHAPIWSS